MARMQLKITKKMMDEIDKALKHLPERYDHLKGSYADIAIMDEWHYGLCVDTAWKHEEDRYTDKKNGKTYFKALIIEYAPELYAYPLYLTTKDLREIARRAAAGKKEITLEEFMEEFIAFVNI